MADLQVLDVRTLFARVESYRTDLNRETMLYPGCRRKQSGRGVDLQFSKSNCDSPNEKREQREDSNQSASSSQRHRHPRKGSQSKRASTARLTTWTTSPTISCPVTQKGATKGPHPPLYQKTSTWKGSAMISIRSQFPVSFPNRGEPSRNSSASLLENARRTMV